MSVNNRTASKRLLPVKVQPGAGRNEVTGYFNGTLEVKIAVPPEKGKANRELVNYFSRLLEVKPSSISIVKGTTSRNKLIAIEALTPEEIVKRLRA